MIEMALDLNGRRHRGIAGIWAGGKASEWVAHKDALYGVSAWRGASKPLSLSLKGFVVCGRDAC